MLRASRVAKEIILPKKFKVSNPSANLEWQTRSYMTRAGANTQSTNVSATKKSTSNATTTNKSITKKYTPNTSEIYFPYGDASFDTVMKPKQGVFRVDKTEFIRKIDEPFTRAIVSLRPRRFGKSLFLNTLEHYYDKKYKQKKQFKDVFGHLDIGKMPTRYRSSYCILKINFSGLSSRSGIVSFIEGMENIIQRALRDFQDRYGIRFDIAQTAADSFANMISAAKIRNEQVFVLIDEYDTSINAVLNGKQFSSTMQGPTKRVEHTNTSNNMEEVEEYFKAFFSRVKTACEDGVARVFVTGITPLVIAEFSSIAMIDISITKNNNAAFASLYGFSTSDVRRGLALIHPPLHTETIEYILSNWKDVHDGYWFSPAQHEALYNPTAILFGLRMIQDTLNSTYDPSNPRTPEAQGAYLLSRIGNDANTAPAEAALHLISANADSSTIFDELLARDKAPVLCPGGLISKFKLSELEQEDNTRLLLSFLYYLGALTHAPPSSESKQLLKQSPSSLLSSEQPSTEQLFVSSEQIDHVGQTEKNNAYLVIPNRRANEEFTTKAMQLFHIRYNDSFNVKAGLITLVERQDISRLISAVEDTFRRFASRDAKDAEVLFSAGFFRCLLLTRLQGDEVYREYKVIGEDRRNNSKGPAVDIVYNRNKQHRYVISLKSVPAGFLDSAKGQDFSDWEISNSLIDKTISELGELGCTFVMDDKKCHTTIKKIADHARQEIITKYHKHLTTDQAEEGVPLYWVAVRAGMYRIYWRKLSI